LTTIQIPSTIGAAKRELGSLGALLTATEWQRAAIVWAFTHESENGGDRRSDQSSDLTTDRLTIANLIRQNITGLRSRNSIAAYREAWERAMEAGARDVRPGDNVRLPKLTWPGVSDEQVARTIHDPDRRDRLRSQAEADGVGSAKVIDIAGNPKAMAAAIVADPKIAHAAEQALVRRPEYQGANRAAETVRGKQASKAKSKDAGFTWSDSLKIRVQLQVHAANGEWDKVRRIQSELIGLSDYAAGLLAEHEAGSFDPDAHDWEADHAN
jgi:hypothetical protein